MKPTKCPHCVSGYVQETGFDLCEKCGGSGVMKRAIIGEQSWLGLALMIFWSLVIMAFFFGCSATGAECKIEWNAQADATSFRVYCGLDLLATVTATTAIVDLPRDVVSTLSVVAVNVAGTSAPSHITVVPFTPQHSEDLRVWIAHPTKAFFVEAKPRIFARYAYPTP